MLYEVITVDKNIQWAVGKLVKTDKDVFIMSNFFMCLEHMSDLWDDQFNLYGRCRIG